MHLTRAWVEIDLGALRRNGAALAARARHLLPMLKADAYGLGAVAVARALESLAPWGYGLSTVDEGAELRAAGIDRRLLLFTPLSADDLATARAERLTPMLSHADDVARWVALGGGPWHLGIDTGMSRAGARWDDVRGLRAAVAQSAPEGACTHFHSAELDDGSMEEQERRFESAIAALPTRPAVLHAENSAALARRATSRWDLARPGIFLYGVGTGAAARIEPEPIVTLRARVVDVRTIAAGDTVSYDATYRAPASRRIATLAIGYADGYPRALSSRGEALLRGRRVPVVGVVTMDMVMLDVTDTPCERGDTATLIGADGGERIDVDAVAARASASPYEILTRLRGRLPRTYRNGA
ncbi:MAG TPA: alanine racemase [Gemmatimonadaceae bacterium]|nr:alanine racemase [Gemmatimonadaceae bacterium]